AGPVAVIGSLHECYAAINELAVDGLFAQFLADKPPERLGQAWLGLQQGIAQGKSNPLTFRVLDEVDGSKGKTALADQRLEHLEMFILLGDPALKMPARATPFDLKAPAEAKAGETIAVSADMPKALHGCSVRVTVERPLTSEPPDLVALPKKS